MLANISIKNIVLIDHLEIDFKQGLSVLTGETGAGKSVLLDSLGLVLGARANGKLVRSGQEKATVSANFELSKDHPVLNILEESDIDVDGALILRRSLTKEGKSKAFVNDDPVSVSLLKKIGELLVEIHGQYDTHSLLNPQTHLFLLDSYAAHSDLVENVRNCWEKFNHKKKSLQQAYTEIDAARREEDFYRESLEDLDALSPQEGEEDKLTALRTRLMRKEQISKSIIEAQESLGDLEMAADKVWRALSGLADEGKDATHAMQSVNAEIEEVSAAITNLSLDLESSEYSLEEIDDRLFSLKAQARKHSCNIDDLPAKREEISELLAGIENKDEYLAKLIKEVESLQEQYKKQAEKLSSSRQKAAKKLAVEIMKELPPLKLEKARFEISCLDKEEDQWNANGMNNVQFLVATNSGSEAGPLHKIASGGEMARLMLALKVVLSKVDETKTLVFDEVDSGVGGATAAAVGERLAKLAQEKQVMVVTHSPQVAAQAQNHWIVSKSGNDVVTTNVVLLNEEKLRQEEIARMISGASVTKEARAAASKLLEAAVA